MQKSKISPSSMKLCEITRHYKRVTVDTECQLCPILSTKAAGGADNPPKRCGSKNYEDGPKFIRAGISLPGPDDFRKSVRLIISESATFR